MHRVMVVDIICLFVGISANVTMISVAAVDVAVCGVHTVLFTAVAISLLLLSLMKKSSHIERSYLSSHTARTVFMLVLLAVQVLVLLKDVLSAVPRASSYVASLLTVVGTSAGLVYSDVVGNTRPMAVALLLLLYWFACSALRLLRAIACFLLQPSLTTDVDVCLFLDAFILLIYIGLLIMECVWIINNVSVHLLSILIRDVKR